MNDELLKAFAEWVLSRPPEVQQAMLKIPPRSTVRAREGRVLACPAPGEVGVVYSYVQYKAHVSVIVSVIDNPVAGECRPEWLEVVDDRAPADRAFVRSLLEPAS